MANCWVDCDESLRYSAGSGWADDDQYLHHMVTFYNVKLKVINKCRPHCAINCQGNIKPYGRNTTQAQITLADSYYLPSWLESFGVLRGFRFWSKSNIQTRHSFFSFPTSQLGPCYGGFLCIEECGGWKPRHLIIIFQISTYRIVKKICCSQPGNNLGERFSIICKMF